MPATVSRHRRIVHSTSTDFYGHFQDVDKTFKFWGSDEGDFIHPADCMQQLLEQVWRHRVNIGGNVCPVIVTILVLEGWQRKLDPEHDVMQALLFEVDWVDSLFYTIEGLMAP